MKELEIPNKSIDYTNILKTFISKKKYREGINFFKKNKPSKELEDVRISYNCALNIYTYLNDEKGTFNLFEEIGNDLGHDYITYSIMVKIFV